MLLYEQSVGHKYSSDSLIITAYLKKDRQNFDKAEVLINGYFVDEDLKIISKNYYFSNVIARASKTMLDCHNSKLDIKRTGTEG